MPQKEKGTFNKSMLLEEYSDVWSILEEGIKIFLDDYPNLMEEIKTAISEKNKNALEASAHSLKGALSYLFANSAETAFQLELMGREGEFSKTSDVYSALKNEIQQLHSDLLELKLNKKSA